MRRANRFDVLLAVMFLAPSSSVPAQETGAPPMSKTDAVPSSRSYEPRQVEGWTVHVNREFLAGKPELAAQVLRLLDQKLYQVTRVVPADALAKLRTIPIWLEEHEPDPPCMCYHPDEGWLRQHGVDPRKAHCIEIANVSNFLKFSREQPWMLLHELAHGYHHDHLPGGFENEEIRAAFARAAQARLYESVLRYDGTTRRAYAATNVPEYFAEMSEAYFGTNDQYPFVRPELRRHDPSGFAVVERAWGIAPSPAGKPEEVRAAPTTRARRTGPSR